MKLIINNKLETKNRNLCAISPRNEWSGFLFYTYDKNEGTINALDMLLMDVGEHTHTSIDVNEKVAIYKMQNGLMHCHTGLIHSHNNFQAFFSPEDMGTIREEISEEYPYFLSVVVNNAGNYVAKFAQKGKKVEEITIIEKQYLIEQDKEILVKEEEKKDNKVTSIAVITDLSIEKPHIVADGIFVDFGNLANIKGSAEQLHTQGAYNTNLLKYYADINSRKQDEKEKEKEKENLPKLPENNPTDSVTAETLILRMISGISWVIYTNDKQVAHYMSPDIIAKTVNKLPKTDYINYCSFVLEIDLGLLNEVLAKVKDLVVKYTSKESQALLSTILHTLYEYVDDYDEDMDEHKERIFNNLMEEE